MAKPKRTDMQRLDDLPLIASLSLKGWKQREIAGQLNSIRPYELTQQQISYDLAEIEKIYIEAASQKILVAKGRALATLEMVAKEAWQTFETSKKPSVIKTSKATVVGGTINADGVLSGGSITNREVTERTIEKIGDKGFLEVIADTVKQQRAILGVDAPPAKELPTEDGGEVSAPLAIPAELMTRDFIDPWRDIVEGLNNEYLFFGGRGSIKSTFVSLAFICLLVNNPNIHGVAMRQVGKTLHDSVYSQIKWAINKLGLDDDFRCLTSPLQIQYKPTGQIIYFRGADDPVKLKSIKPPFGYIGLLWLEELDQFKGAEAVRKIKQSVIRGGNLSYTFESFNPPRTSGNWVNKYRLIKKPKQYQHYSSYLSVPVAWLGQPFIDEADHLKAINLAAYNHEYLGEVNGTGGQVFENVTLRKITDAEIKEFDRVHHGLDFGFYPDPAHYVRCHYDAARLKLYVYVEVRKYKLRNRKMYDEIVKAGLRQNDLLICDSAEPKSVADYREFGANARGAEKGADSLDYSIKWLQGLAEIVIDSERCPATAEEFTDYEYEQDPDGNFISEYPDKNDHGIAAVRYAMNLVWRVRGK